MSELCDGAFGDSAEDDYAKGKWNKPGGLGEVERVRQIGRRGPPRVGDVRWATYGGRCPVGDRRSAPGEGRRVEGDEH